MKELIGKKIEEIYVAEGEHYLLFETDQGRIIYATEGECCSETWFADVIGVEALIGHTVKGVIDIDNTPEPLDDRTRQEYDKLYGIKIVTDHPWSTEATIVYRNSSNGYYGGDCMLVDSILEDVELRKIVEDWSA